MRRKRIQLMICLLVFFCIFQTTRSVFADTPLILSLNLKGQSLKNGESTEVIVSMDNYDENFADFDITTVIIEVSVDTVRLQVDADSITPGFEDKSGNGFIVCRMSDNNNVELQYLNITSPLEKGTKNLYSFEITALQDIDQLADCLQISYAIMEDGSKKEIKEFELITTTRVDGSIVENETIDQSYTSEYGTMAEHPSASEIVSELIEKETNPSVQETTSAGQADSSEMNTTESSDYLMEDDETENGESGKDTDAENENGESGEDTEEETVNQKKDEKSNSMVPIIIVVVVIVFVGVVVVSMLLYRRKRQSQIHE